MAKEERGVVKYQSRGNEVTLTAEIVRSFLVTGKKELVTDQEIMYFLGICRERQLNPFVKDCYLIKYGSEPAAIITAIDFYRSRARAASDCTGWEKGVICLKNDGTLRYSKGLVLPDEQLVGGWFRARPTGWTVDFELEVNLEGYIKKTASGDITKFWSKVNQPSQIMKVAESQGLRTVWPDLFQGTITAEEAGMELDAGGMINVTPGPEDKKSPAKIDTSKFDEFIAAKDLSPERLEHLNAMNKAAAAHRKVKEPEFKVYCAEKGLDAYWAAFEAWEKKNFPGTEQDQGSEAASISPEHFTRLKENTDLEILKLAYANCGVAWETAVGELSDETATKLVAEVEKLEADIDRQVEEGAKEGIVVPFNEQTTAIWKMTIQKGVPLPELYKAVGVSALGEITPDNIDAVKAFVDGWKAPGKKK